MTGYSQINILEISEIMGEEFLQSIISDFSCPFNIDVESFFTQMQWNLQNRD